MPKTLNEIIEMEEALIQTYVGRDQLFDEMEETYFMTPADKAKIERQMGENAKLTLSPTGNIKVKGGARLLSATLPHVSVSYGNASRDVTKEKSNKLELAARAMLAGAGRIAGQSIHYDYILSGMIYGEASMEIKSVKKLIDILKGANKAGYLKRAERAYQRTPVLFKSLPPRQCYAGVDDLGLWAHLRQSEATLRDVQAVFGEKAAHLTGSDKDKKQLREWWDLEDHAVTWGGQEILRVEHELDAIPISYCLVEGSRAIFEKIKQQIQPFLYAYTQSGLWHRENLALTTLFTNILTLGKAIDFVYESQSGKGKPVKVDYSRGGVGVALIETGERLTQTQRNTVDPNLMRALDIINTFSNQATIYNQTFGEPLGANAPYSMVSLLHHAGRQPLISPQTRLSHAIGNALEIAFNFLKTDGLPVYMRYEKAFALSPDDIPDNLMVDCSLEISLPTDAIGEANVAAQLAPLGIVSKEHIRENILRDQSGGQMIKDVLKERLMEFIADQYMLDIAESKKIEREMMAAKMQQEMMQPPTPPPGAMPPGAGIPPAGPPMPIPGQVPAVPSPDQMAGPAEGGAIPGAPPVPPMEA